MEYYVAPKDYWIAKGYPIRECSSPDACEMIERILDSPQRPPYHKSYPKTHLKFKIFRWTFRITIHVTKYLPNGY
jgi:hypothetical protein